MAFLCMTMHVNELADVKLLLAIDFSRLWNAFLSVLNGGREAKITSIQYLFSGFPLCSEISPDLKNYFLFNKGNIVF